MDRIRGEWRRRKKAGGLSDNKAANARDLHRWAVENIASQGQKIPKPDSIERRIRHLYEPSGPDKQAG